MAEILIPVKNPPKNCHECKNGWCNLWEQNKNMTTGKHPDCPMKELPPHGDLIERSSVYKVLDDRIAFYEEAGDEYDACNIACIEGDIVVIPTIIEASKEREKQEAR